MRILFLILAALSVAASSSGRTLEDTDLQTAPARSLRIVVQPAVAMNYGTARYVMDQPVDSGTVRRVRSELVFPLDGFLAGVRFGISPSVKHPRWSVEASLMTNLNDPNKIMTDGDWVTGQHFSNLKISSTESDAKGKTLEIEIKGYFDLAPNSGLGLDGVVGFSYFHLNQDIIGIRGWQLDSLGHPLYFPDIEYFRNVKGIVYKASYYMPQAGLRARLGSGSRLSLDASLLGVIAIVNDFDDHLLRNKNATGDGIGLGLLVGVKSEYRIPYGSVEYSLGLSFDLMTAKVMGSQTQRWYGDDPATPNHNDTGDVLTNVNHDMSTTQYRAGLRLGLSF